MTSREIPKATPQTVTAIVEGLDHPECLCVGSDGWLYAGGEGGQIYRFNDDGRELRQVASTGGFLLGVTADGDGGIQACDTTRGALLRIASDGSITQRAGGFTLPNFALFAENGDLFVSDSGTYWSTAGTGVIRCLKADGSDVVFHHGPFRFANGLAFDLTRQWLYVIESRAGTILRISATVPDSTPTLICQMPPERVPDGVTLLDDGRLLVSCYTPDELWLVEPGGAAQCIMRDPTHELLVCPANTLLHNQHLYIANIGGWSIARMETDLRPGPVFHPRALHPGTAIVESSPTEKPIA